MPCKAIGSYPASMNMSQMINVLKYCSYGMQTRGIFFKFGLTPVIVSHSVLAMYNIFLCVLIVHALTSDCIWIMFDKTTEYYRVQTGPPNLAPFFLDPFPCLLTVTEDDSDDEWLTVYVMFTITRINKHWMCDWIVYIYVVWIYEERLTYFSLVYV